MMWDEMILRTVRPVISAWLARLADRVADLREQVRLGVIEAVGRTTAEAVEWLLQAAVGVARRPEPTGRHPPDDFDDAAVEAYRPRPPVTQPPRPAWVWRTALVTALHAAGEWLRHRVSPPVAAVATALIGAAVVLLD